MDARTRPEEDPALTPEVRAIVRPRLHWPLWVTLAVAVALGGAALAAWLGGVWR